MIEDYRLKKAVEFGITFAGKKVLEASCGFGAITRDLCEVGADVTSFDIRQSNIDKARIRCKDFSPRFILLDADNILTLGRFDLICHIGLIYHLDKPVTHLKQVLQMSNEILLDTHIAADGWDTQHDGGLGKWWNEGTDAYSSKPGQPKSFWLTDAEIKRIASEEGFRLTTLIDNPHASVAHRMFYHLIKQ